MSKLISISRVSEGLPNSFHFMELLLEKRMTKLDEISVINRVRIYL